MFRLVESIHVWNGTHARLALHQQRVNRAFSELYKKKDPLNLEAVLSAQSVPATGLYKCRVVYDASSFQVAYIPYTIRPVSSLKVVRNNEIQYSHKFENRELLNALYDQRGICDDILISKGGKITDCSYANIAFYTGREWVTPSHALLAGTMRQALLQEKKIVKAEITEGDLPGFKKFKLINALLEWSGAEVEVNNKSLVL